MANSMLDAALNYAKRGWPVFPCGADKKPKTENGVLDATTDLKQIEEWWHKYPRANIGFHPGAVKLMVLDLDPGSDRAALIRIAGETGLIQKTPRGGEHLFYALDSSDPPVAPSASKVAPNVDVRSFHSYVLLSPSSTAAGAYVWAEEGIASFRTDEVLRLAHMARAKHEDQDTWLIEADLPENVAAAAAWLKKDAKIAVEGVNGDHMAYATAAHLKSFGISEAMAFELMWEHWNPRCSPPWGDDQVDHLEQKVRNGYTYNTSPPGNITAAYKVARAAAAFKPVERSLPEGREVTAGRFRAVDYAGMSSIRPPEWLIPDFLPLGAYGMLVGGYGTFKTFLAIDIALSVATGAAWGGDWQGLWPVIGNPGPVLFAVGEGRPEFHKRVQAWVQTHGKVPSDLVLVDPVPLVEEELDPFLEVAMALQPNGYKLVIIDTVGRSMQGLNENTQEHASKFTRLVERLQYELGHGDEDRATVLALHHTGHDHSRARGSSVFGADADTVVTLDREDDAMTVALHLDRAHGGKQKDAAEWSKPKHAKLVEVKVGPKVSSLVALRDDAVAVSRNPERAAASEAFVASVLDKAIRAVLASNKTRAWTSKELAEAVAMPQRGVGLSSKTLQNTALVAIREKAGTYASRAYDPATRRWRYSEGE